MNEDQDGLTDLRDRLTAARPRPESSFVARLAKLIESSTPGASSRGRVGPQIVAFTVAGILLLAIAAAVTFL